MKKVIILTLVSGLTASCTSTRIDDHSYHHNDNPAPPVKIVNNNYINSAPATPAPRVNNYYNYQTPRNVYQDDQDFLQYQQTEPRLTPSSYRGLNFSYRGLHNRIDVYGERTVVPAQWNVSRYPSIPSGRIPTFCY